MSLISSPATQASFFVHLALKTHYKGGWQGLWAYILQVFFQSLKKALPESMRIPKQELISERERHWNQVL